MEEVEGWGGVVWSGLESDSTFLQSDSTIQRKATPLPFQQRTFAYRKKFPVHFSTQPEPFANDITRTSLKECSRQAENWMRSGRPLGFGPIL